MYSKFQILLTGVGSYLPKKKISNYDLEKFMDTSDEWIRKRTGIKFRHFVEDNELTSDMGTNAAELAILNAGLKPNDIDLIILATTTPDNTFPSTATKVQNHLKIKNIPSFDIQAVCSGFIYGMEVADSFIKSQKYSKILLIGAETLSKIVDWKDRRTCVLFGDGAGAVILSPSTKKKGVLSTKLYSDGSWIDSLFADG